MVYLLSDPQVAQFAAGLPSDTNEFPVTRRTPQWVWT